MMRGVIGPCELFLLLKGHACELLDFTPLTSISRSTWFPSIHSSTLFSVFETTMVFVTCNNVDQFLLTLVIK
jgi:hypothetical protein